MDKKNIMTINISTGSILRVIGVLVFIWFLYFIKDILLLFFVSLVLASAFDPMVDWFERKNFPRPVGILLIYAVFLFFIAISVYLLIPALTEQARALIANLPSYWQQIVSKINWLSHENKFLLEGNNLQDYLKNILSFIAPRESGNIFSLVSGFIGGIATLFISLVVTYYMVVEENSIKKIFQFVAPLHYRPFLINLVVKIRTKIGWWLRGQLILSVIIGISAYIGLLLLGVEYALVLAIIAAVTEIIPYAGPILGAIPAVLLAFSQSPILAFWTLILYIIIQQLENNIIVPKVMQKTVGLNPIITIFAFLIGAKLAGIVGVILAIPVATALNVAVEELYFWETEKKNNKDQIKEEKKKGGVKSKYV